MTMIQLLLLLLLMMMMMIMIMMIEMMSVMSQGEENDDCYFITGWVVSQACYVNHYNKYRKKIIFYPLMEPKSLKFTKLGTFDCV